MLLYGTTTVCHILHRWISRQGTHTFCTNTAFWSIRHGSLTEAGVTSHHTPGSVARVVQGVEVLRVRDADPTQTTLIVGSQLRTYLPLAPEALPTVYQVTGVRGKRTLNFWKHFKQMIKYICIQKKAAKRVCYTIYNSRTAVPISMIFFWIRLKPP